MKKVIRDFECAMCGQCCANQDLVQLTTYELYSLARHRNMEPAAFFNRYCLVTATNLSPAPHLYIRTANGACPFLDDKKCSVHEARPYACRAYPMRAYWTLAGNMQAFVRSSYPMLEETCSLFKLDDGIVLLGDYELLAKQTIAYWVDDAYFTMAGGAIDLSIPYRVADLYLQDKEMLSVAKRHAINSGHPPTAFAAELAYATISLTLQAAMWNSTAAFVPVEEQAVQEDERLGKYLLLTTDADSVKALRMLVESGRLDRVKTLAIGSKAYEGRYIIAATHGSSSDHVALGFILETDKGTLEALTDDGKKPLYVFFRAEGTADGKLAGFPLDIKIEGDKILSQTG